MVKFNYQTTNPPKPERNYTNMVTHKQLSFAEIYSDCETFFKYDKPIFLTLLQNTINFEELVHITEIICQKINCEKAAMTIFDTSDVEAFVTGDNPKYSNKIITQIKV